MKLPVCVSAMLLSGLLVSCAIAPTWSSEPEANFGFIFEFGRCNVDKLDTFAGMFTQDQVVEPSITVPLELTDEQMSFIYEQMITIKIDEYPEEFKISEPLFGEYVLLSTGYYYLLQVVNREMNFSTRWVDNVAEPTTENADRLRDFFQQIIAMVKDHPNYKQLPETNFGCV